ncbi:ATPase [Iodidimonas gelatinilytica]|uniref:histidine kinase n=1 Tax=Iodidimonas gelatinilytica TaxID=1236966 RepID=A0A5A7MYC3_9PROT|nr:ATPase [Iodidimonas gelatinilytica]GER00992.1 ATPase [Iodidimonas gelatinilytica]
METGVETLRSSLSSRLLLLTICFVMVVEVFVYVPSIAQFRRSFLEQRITAAQIAALSLVEAPDHAISKDLEFALLRTAGVKAVSLQLGDRRQLMMEGDAPARIDARYDLRKSSIPNMIGDAFVTLARGGKGTIMVSGEPLRRLGEEEISIILDESALFDAMALYSRNVMVLSVIISVFTAGLVFLTLHFLMVRPMRQITRSMVAFRQRPDDPERAIVPSDRHDELGVAERELARMQEELRLALNQRKRLAHVGAAVSKVNHDLRNILATAQLSSDRLMMIDDPKVRDMSSRMISAIDRAIVLCERTLKYGRADEPPPKKRTFNLHDLIEDVRASVGLDLQEENASDDGPKVHLDNAVQKDFALYADPDHMFRVLMNLVRNAANILERTGGRVAVTAERKGECHFVRVSDTGPGLSKKARENLFVPFKGSTGARGTGLGLAIVAELVEANGGRVALEHSDDSGTTFVIELPCGAST